MTEHSFVALKEDEGERIDKFLSKNISDISRSAIANLIEKESLRVNGVLQNKKYKVNLSRISSRGLVARADESEYDKEN